MSNGGEAILSAATATGAGASARDTQSKDMTFHAVGATTNSTGAAVIDIEVTNKPVPAADADWLVLGTISLTLGTTQTGDGFAVCAAWDKVRANVKSISGTGANVTVFMGA